MLTPIIAIAGAIALPLVTYRPCGVKQHQPASTQNPNWLPSIRAPKTGADFLFWIAGVLIVTAAAWTVAARVMTGDSALLVLLGTVLLIVASFTSGRSDATHWALWLLLVSGFVIELLPYIRLHPR